MLRVTASLTVALAIVTAACGSGDDASRTTMQVHATATNFPTVADMAAASDVVVVGTVADVVAGDFQPAPEIEDFAGTQNLLAIVEVERVLVGDVAVGEAVAVPWSGYEVGDDGTPGPTMIVNGQPTPAVGDRDVWFLASHTEGTLGLVAYEGRVRVADDGSLETRGPVGSGAERELEALTGLEQLAATLAAAQGG